MPDIILKKNITDKNKNENKDNIYDRNNDQKGIIEITEKNNMSPNFQFPPKKRNVASEINNKYEGKNSDSNILSMKTNERNKKINDKKKETSKFANNSKKENISIIEPNIIEERKSLYNGNIILDNYELNNLEYEEALILDKRSFFQIYWSLLKREHIILFTFFFHNDYNLYYVKNAKFIFLLATDMAMNVFFFSD